MYFNIKCTNRLTAQTCDSETGVKSMLTTYLALLIKYYLCKISPVRVLSKNSNSWCSIDEKRLYLIRMATFSPTFDSKLMHTNVDNP